MYRLLFHPAVEKQLAKIPRASALRLANAIRALGENPRPAQAKHLDQQFYRLRDGDYRIIYAIFDQDSIVYIGKIERRSEKTYRDLAQLLERARRATGQERK